MQINHLLFDMDNTLYPASSQMNAKFSEFLLEIICDFFHCDLETAVRLKKERIVHYSTTLEWLRSEGLEDVEGFFAHVHPENEADELKPQPGLRDFLISLDYPKSILTNSPIEHALRVLKKLEIADLFESVTDIRDCNLYGKPYSLSYETALKKAGAKIESTVFFDDMTKYVDGWRRLGGTAVLVGEDNGRPLAADAEPLKTGKAAVKEGALYRIPDIYETEKILELIRSTD